MQFATIHSAVERTNLPISDLVITDFLMMRCSLSRSRALNIYFEFGPSFAFLLVAVAGD